MEKGAIGSHKLDGEGSTSTSDMQAVRFHRSDGHRDRPHRFGSHRSDGERVPQVHLAWRKDPAGTRNPLGPTDRMLKGPTSTRRMEKGPSGGFYDKLQASQMSNCRSHRYTSDGEGTVWRSMVKRCRYRSNIVHHRSVINSMTKPCSS